MSNNKNIHTTQVQILNRTLGNPTSKSVRVDTAWIPSKLAKVGKFIRIYNSQTEQWEDGWEIRQIFETRIYQEALEDENNYKTQREASDSYDNQGPVATAFMKG